MNLLALLALLRGDLQLGPLGGAVFLLVLTGGAIYMASQGYRYWRGAHSISDAAVASASIDRLFRTGNPLWGPCYAAVSFTDAAGAARTTTVGVIPKVWQYLREGGKVSITYSRGNPNKARFGGSGAQAIYSLAGVAFMTIGTGLAILFLFLLIAGWIRWIDLTPFRDIHR